LKEDRRSTGTVSWFDDARGVGVITNESGEKVSLHYRDIQLDGQRTLQANRRVSYEEAEDDRGLFATYVQPI